MRLVTGALLCALCCCAPALPSEAQDAPAAAKLQPDLPSAPAVATVDLFGYSGWNGDDPFTDRLRQRLAARVGQKVVPGQAAAFRRKVQGDVVAVTEKPATDVAIVCCDASGGLSVFIGVQGKDAVPLEQRATPTGPETLPPEGLGFYEEEEKSSAAANAHGVSGEDDSQGYALSADPPTRKAQEEMHAFAIAHEAEVARVLQRSGLAAQRRAAAALLGYAQRSKAQVSALLAAVNDDDDGVRNNAVRALSVLATTGPLPGLNAEPFVGLLYSGVWTDRNKASSLFATLTRGRDPKLLKLLRTQALPPLIEGARWKSASHAYFFALVLARVVGIADEQAEGLIRDGKTAEIVQRAVALRVADGKR